MHMCEAARTEPPCHSIMSASSPSCFQVLRQSHTLLHAPSPVQQNVKERRVSARHPEKPHHTQISVYLPFFFNTENYPFVMCITCIQCHVPDSIYISWLYPSHETATQQSKPIRFSPLPRWRWTVPNRSAASPLFLLAQFRPRYPHRYHHCCCRTRQLFLHTRRKSLARPPLVWPPGC